MDKVSLYALTEEEINIVNNLNESRTNVLLIVCSLGECTGVDPEALQKPEFSVYLDALGGTFNPDKVVEVEIEYPFNQK